MSEAEGNHIQMILALANDSKTKKEYEKNVPLISRD